MDWWLWIIIVIVILGVLSKGAETADRQKQRENEEAVRKKRVQKARETILKSGNQQLINQLHLMDATQRSRKEGGKAGPSGLEIAGGVVGGIVIANVITSAAQAHAIEQAFAEIQQGMNEELRSIGADIEEMSESVDDDFEF